MILALDTETTGVDFRHGCRPFFVSVCDQDNQQTYWEWEVDPKTRQPLVSVEDLEQIQQVIDQADFLVLQNHKFDVTGLVHLFQDYGKKLRWDWSKVHDTLLAGHLLATGLPHNLTDMVAQYLGVDISVQEKALQVACQAARRQARSQLKSWVIAKDGIPSLPSVKKSSSKTDSAWRNDYWLPRAVARVFKSAPRSWLTVLSDYGNLDPVVTLPLWSVMEQQLRDRKLWKIYNRRRRIPQIAYDIEQYGITVSKQRLKDTQQQFRQQARLSGELCVGVAASYDHQLTLPKSGNNNSLSQFCFDRLQLPVISRSKKTQKPSLNKEALEIYENTLPTNSKQLLFIKNLQSKRKRDTAVSYMTGYKRYWLPVVNGCSMLLDPENPLLDWYRLHPDLNPTGTKHLRWSCRHPNEQNISKQPGFNLRRMFGPAPGREWWSLDAKNLELRIPAFEADEKELIYVFQHPNDPPYFGSYHLVVFDTLHPQLFAQHGKKVKDLYEATYYQWVKNGNFAVIYGCQQAKADITYHVPGAFEKVRHRFPKIAQLADKQIALANSRGYVETLPDRTVDPERGYPIMCGRTSWGGVRPTLPLNYHVSGSAMWWMQEAMIRCHQQLNDWRATYDGHITMQVHDELVFDLPAKGDPVKDYVTEKEKHGKPYFRTSNLWRVRVLQRLMGSCGEGIGVPTPVSVEYHNDNWAEGVIL